MSVNYDLITILGPTASGKTKVAVHLASKINSEIISADSRQVYRGMDIGTGKDLNEYNLNSKKIPYHLIDIIDAGEKYNLFSYQKDFFMVYNQIKEKKKIPILCGGSGMYIDSVTKGYKMQNVPFNIDLRNKLQNKSLEDLISILELYKETHNKSDQDNKERAIRAIEIADYQIKNRKPINFPRLRTCFVGLRISREKRREKITKRLTDRLNNGMIEEVSNLLKTIPSDNLIYYGLEYKYVTLYLLNEISYKEMFTKLEIAIHQFSKKQETWFRGMERKGVKIHWIDALKSDKEKTEMILNTLNN